MTLFLEWSEVGRMDRGNTYGGRGRRPKNFRKTSNSYLLLEGELYVSDNLGNSRGADEESELSSILTYTTLGKWRCQPQALLKRPTDFLMENRSARITLFRRHNDAHLGRDFC
jgi:hypothetical protein